MAWINIAVLLPNDIVQHSPLILLIIYLYQLIPPHIQANRRPTGNLFASRLNWAICWARCWCLPVASKALWFQNEEYSPRLNRRLSVLCINRRKVRLEIKSTVCVDSRECLFQTWPEKEVQSRGLCSGGARFQRRQRMNDDSSRQANAQAKLTIKRTTMQWRSRTT